MLLCLTGDPGELFVGVCKLFERAMNLLSKDDPGSQALGVATLLMMVGCVVVLWRELGRQGTARPPRERRRSRTPRKARPKRSQDGDGSPKDDEKTS